MRSSEANGEFYAARLPAARMIVTLTTLVLQHPVR